VFAREIPHFSCECMAEMAPSCSGHACCRSTIIITRKWEGPNPRAVGEIGRFIILEGISPGNPSEDVARAGTYPSAPA
jgi:hypothetical protein